MRKELWVVLIAAALLGTLLIWRQGPPRGIRPERVSDDRLSQSRSSPSEPAEARVPPTVTEASRTPASPAVRVVDSDGRPLANARIDRIPRPADWRVRLDGWPAEEDRDVRAATRTAVTDSAGVAELPELDSSFPSDGSLILAIASGRQAAWLAIPGPEANDSRQRELRMPSSAVVVVTVLGTDGRPVPGAVVTERADFRDWPVLSDEERDARQFEFLPRVLANTDAQGVARLPVLPASTWIQATSDTLVSAAWTGSGPRQVTLRLLATCEIQGRVVDESGAGGSISGVVSCQARRGYDTGFIRLAPVRSGGLFGPVRLPLSSHDGFLLQYFGGELEATQAIIDSPQVGSLTTIEIRTRPGQGVDLLVTDEVKRPVANVSVVTQWVKDDVWSRTDRRTDSAGRARLANLPTGEVWVRLRKPGFVPETRQLFRSEQWAHHPLDVALHRAASIDGKCSFAGKPARNFIVYFWQQDIASGGKVAVEDSEDGAFTIEEAAPGLVQLFASSDDVVQSEPMSLTVDAGSRGTVELFLPAPRTVVGQVVDAESGEPIPKASVVAIVLAGAEAVRPWKAAEFADDEGRFEMHGLGTVDCMLRVEAKGFSTRAAFVHSGADLRVEAGRIAMHRALTLVARLHSTSDLDLASYGLTLNSDTRHVPGARFSPEGLLTIDDLAPGLVEVRLEASNGSSENRTVRIRPGGNNACDFYFEGEVIEIEVVPSSGQSLPDNARVGVSFVDSRGWQIHRSYPMSPSGLAITDRIDTQRVLLEVHAADGECLAMGAYRLPADGPRRIVFQMNPRPLRLRLVDDAHAPIVGANVFLTADRGGAKWSTWAGTDEVGEVRFEEVGPGDVRVGVYDIKHGALPCTLLALGGAGAEVAELTMPQGTRVTGYLSDGGEALPSVELELLDSCGSVMSTGRLLTGSDGQVVFQHLAPGDYLVAVDHPGIWRTEQPISVTAASASFTVQLRRLGSARIRVRSGVGNPIEGASIDLIDTATGTRVADWIASGEVPAPAGGLRTDAGGALVIQGLPHGSYRCVLTTAAGDTLERTLEVPPQATGDLEVVTP